MSQINLHETDNWQKWFAWRPVRGFTWLKAVNYTYWLKFIWRRPSQDPNRKWEYRD